MLAAGVIPRKEDLTYRNFPENNEQLQAENNVSSHPVPGVVQKLRKIVTSVQYDKEDSKPATQNSEAGGEEPMGIDPNDERELVGEDELSSDDEEKEDETIDGAEDFMELAPELVEEPKAAIVTTAAPRYKKMIASAQRKRKHTDDVKKVLANEENIVRLSSKLRRKTARDEKKKEQRQHFYYENANVKNKNRAKKGHVDEDLASRGHTKKKTSKK